MKSIEVSDELYESLMEISKNMNNQDRRATASPYYYCIQESERVYGMDSGYSDDYIWIYSKDTENNYETDQDVIDELVEEAEYDPKSNRDTPGRAKRLKRKLESLSKWKLHSYLEDAGYEKIGYIEKHTHNNFFFTEKACNEHIRINRHNLKKPQSYVEFGFRNPELEIVVNFLSELSK